MKKISISEENYNNFKKCIIPLIGALAEITYSLNNLKKSNLLSEEQEKSLYKDEIIYSLYIAILYARPNRNAIKIFALMFDLKVDMKFEGINFKMDYLLYDINVIKESNLIWYFSVLFSYASFIRIFYNSLTNSPVSIIDYINKNFNIDSGPRKNFNKTVNFFVLLIQQLYSKEKNEKYNLKFKKEAYRTNKNFLKLIIALNKTILNVEYLDKIFRIKYKEDSIVKQFSKLLNKNRKNIIKL